MHKVDFKSRLSIYTKVLNQSRALSQLNIESYIKALGITFGTVAQRTAGGALGNDLKVTGTPTSITIGAGYTILLSSGEIVVLPVAAQTIDITAYTNNVPYTVTVIPKKHSYEPGKVEFTNGSRTVAITGGDFSKVSKFESIIIDTSTETPSNNGEYRVAITGIGTVELVDFFNGNSEKSLKWKIGGYFGDAEISDKLIYYYDDYDIEISSSGRRSSGDIARFRKTDSAIVITDLRPTNLFSQRGINPVNADDIVLGAFNAITTIEEKSKASRVDKNARDVFSGGVVSGFALTRNGNTLGVGAGWGYDDLGTRIEGVATNLDMDVLRGTGVVSYGNNYLHIYYVAPGSFGGDWSQTGISTNPIHLYLGKINYATGLEEQ